MIERNIHMCWFGNKKISNKNIENVEICKKINKNFNFKLWNEDIFNEENFYNNYVEYCLKNNKYANLSNYARIYLIKKFGGIYLDIDVKCIKSFENLLLKFENKFENIYAFESPNNCDYINNAIFVGKKENEFIKLAYKEFLNKFNGEEPANISSPHFITELIKTNLFKNVLVVKRDYFYPYYFNEEFNDNCITENTFCIHQWDKGW